MLGIPAEMEFEEYPGIIAGAEQENGLLPFPEVGQNSCRVEKLGPV